jgi:hypothetical protein
MDELENNLLHGVAEIATALWLTERRTWHRGALPAFKLAGARHARRSTLAAYFAKLEADAVGKAAA